MRTRSQWQQIHSAENALSLINDVRQEFIDQPASYIYFLNIMKEYREGHINVEEVVACVRRLFQGRNHLFHRFSVYLPDEYRDNDDEISGSSSSSLGEDVVEIVGETAVTTRNNNNNIPAIECGCCQIRTFSSDKSASNPATPICGKCGHSICRECVLSLLRTKEECEDQQQQQQGRRRQVVANLSCPLCMTQNSFQPNKMIPNHALCELLENLEKQHSSWNPTAKRYRSSPDVLVPQKVGKRNKQK